MGLSLYAYLPFLTIQSILALFGMFGHFNIFVATLKKKEIQNKYGLLLVQLSVAQCFCIIGECVNSYMIVFTFHSTGFTCFQLLIFYLSFQIVQSLLLLLIAIDLLLAILFPVFYRDLRTRRCVFFTLTFSLLTALSHGVVSRICLRSFGDNLIMQCDVATFHDEILNWIQNTIIIVFGSMQIAFYVLSYSIMYIRGVLFMRQNPNACYRNQHRKTMLTISVLIVIYSFTSFLSLYGEHLLEQMEDPNWIVTLKMSTSLLLMISYCQSFYVSYWRSTQYRKIYKKVWASRAKFKCPWSRLKSTIIFVASNERSMTNGWL